MINDLEIRFIYVHFSVYSNQKCKVYVENCYLLLKTNRMRLVRYFNLISLKKKRVDNIYYLPVSEVSGRARTTN